MVSEIPTYRSYVQCLQDLNSDEVFEGLLGHGLFSENMPPIFTSEYFYDYVKRSNPNFSQKLVAILSDMNQGEILIQ